MTGQPLKRDLWEAEAQVDAAEKHLEIAISIIREMIGDPKLTEVQTTLAEWKKRRPVLEIHGKLHRHTPLKED